MKEKLALAAVGLAIIGSVWVLGASALCSDAVLIGEAEGACLSRRLGVTGCILGIEVAFGVGAGMQAKARSYPLIMGFLLGFFLNFMGGLFVRTLSRRQPEWARAVAGPQ